MRVVKFSALAVLAVLVCVVIVLVVGLPGGFLVEKIRAQVAAETGYRLDIDGGATLTILPQPSVVVRGVSVVDPVKPGENLFKAESARVDLSFSGLLSGNPKITEFVIVRPVIDVPLVRSADERPPAGAASPAKPARATPDIERVVIEDGTVLFVSGQGKVEIRVEHINVHAGISQPAHMLEAGVDARIGNQALRFTIKGKAPIEKLTQDVMPVDLTVEAPGLLQDKLITTANLLSTGALLKINDVSGAIGKDNFTGWASIDVSASKPRVKLDLDFKRLALAAAAAPDQAALERPSNLAGPWSDQKIDLDGLNFVDAQVSLSMGELAISTIRLAPVFVDASLGGGVMKIALADVGLYDGKAAGEIVVDASKPELRHAARIDLSGVRALPLLSALADFRALDGVMQAKIDVRALGSSARTMAETLGGTVDVVFQDGEIRNVNIAQMLRSLTQSTRNGWGGSKAEKTDLTELSALFKIDAGTASTDNLKITGPLVRVNGSGSADLAAKTLQFKLDTKVVMSLQGQGATAADPVGFGVPVMVEGSWEAPNIYPDMAGILDNPDAAYGKLRELGAGLFGNGNGKSGSDALMQGFGTLLNGKGGEQKQGEPATGDDKQAAPQNKGTGFNEILKGLLGK